MPLTQEREELREKLAAIEHERWADWQKYMHSRCTPQEHDTNMPHCFCNPKKIVQPNGNMAIIHSEYSPLTIPFGLVERWERQIKTPYSELSDAEKKSDMEQVDRYWSLIESFLDQEVERVREAERERFVKMIGLRLTGLYGTIMQDVHAMKQVVGENRDFYVTLQQLEHYIGNETEKIEKLIPPTMHYKTKNEVEKDFDQKFTKQGIPIGIAKYETKDGLDITPEKIKSHIHHIREADLEAIRSRYANKRLKIQDILKSII